MCYTICFPLDMNKQVKYCVNLPTYDDTSAELQHSMCNSLRLATQSYLHHFHNRLVPLCDKIPHCLEVKANKIL